MPIIGKVKSPRSLETQLTWNTFGICHGRRSNPKNKSDALLFDWYMSVGANLVIHKHLCSDLPIFWGMRRICFPIPGLFTPRCFLPRLSAASAAGCSGSAFSQLRSWKKEFYNKNGTCKPSNPAKLRISLQKQSISPSNRFFLN